MSASNWTERVEAGDKLGLRDLMDAYLAGYDAAIAALSGSRAAMAAVLEDGVARHESGAPRGDQ